MSFNSVEFFLLLGAVLAGYYLLGRGGQNALLLVASYVFYGWWDWRFCGLLALSTVVDYTVGRGLARTDAERARRALLVASVVTNLGILGFFKYFDFFTDSAAELLDSIGLNVSPPVLDVVLPVGISFYTFQTMSYTIDVYRRRMEPTRRFLDFALFVSFMPQLVAGPIERARHLLPQFASRRTVPRVADLQSGALLVLLGLFKKVAVADAVAPYVNDVFDDPGAASAPMLVVATYLFAIQIYADFSGYTDIARGTARLLGIDLMRNFAQPYLSRDVTEFWRRWHISLSTWLRDYLYVPLGGNRSSLRRTYVNLMLVMLLGGLWHGAAWTFVVWGGLHGTALALHRRFGGRPHRVEMPTWADLVPIIATFHFVCLAWVFFRANSFGDALDALAGVVSLRGGGVEPSAVAMLGLTGGIVLAIDLVQRHARDQTPMLRWPQYAQGAFYGLCVAAIVLFSGATPVPFIYFQF